jgi:hypothetical protein
MRKLRRFTDSGRTCASWPPDEGLHVPSNRFLDIHKTIQQHLFAPESGTHPVLLDWPACFGKVAPYADAVVVLRRELEAFRVPRNFGIARPVDGQRQHWVIEAALLARAAWEARFGNQTDQPEAPWHLAYLAAMVGAWRDNDDAGEAFWRPIGLGLNGPSNRCKPMRPWEDPVVRSETRWAGLFECLAEWSGQRSDGRFLLQRVGTTPYVSFLRGQRVASSADIRTLAEWMRRGPALDVASVRSAIQQIGTFDRPGLLGLAQNSADNGASSELLEYVVQLVSEELREMRREQHREPLPDPRIALRCFAWFDHDDSRWKHRYLPVAPARDRFPAWVRVNPSIRREFEVIDSDATVDGRPILLQDLTDCERECKGHMKWFSPDERRPIVLGPYGDDYIEEPRGTELDAAGEYLVWHGIEHDFRKIKGRDVLANTELGFEPSRATLLKPASGIRLRPGVYHSLALPQLASCVPPAQDESGNVTVSGDQLDPIDGLTEEMRRVRIVQGGSVHQFAMHNPPLRWHAHDEDEDPVLHHAVAGPESLACRGWTESLEHKPAREHFGLLQVVGALGPRPLKWATQTQRDHFSVQGEDRIVRSLRMLGHLESTLSGSHCILAVRRPELVWMPQLRGPEGVPVFWLRGGFDWWRLERHQIDGARWLVRVSGTGAIPTVAVAAAPEALRTFCRASGARMVDPSQELALLNLRDTDSDASLEADLVRSGFQPDPADWDVFLPFSPTQPRRITFDGSADFDWSVLDALGGSDGAGPFLATRAHDQRQCLFRRESTGAVRWIRDLANFEAHSYMRASVKHFWRRRLAVFTGCDERPCVGFHNGALYLPGKPIWPLELCAALSAFAGTLPSRVGRDGMPTELRRMHDALSRAEPPQWQPGEKVAPACDWSWRYDHIPGEAAQSACAKLDWTVQEIA